MPSVNEILLLHRGSGSLIVADFVVNLRRECSAGGKQSIATAYNWL